MDTDEAQTILADSLEGYRKRGYAKLLPLLRKPETSRLITENGVSYQLEFQAVWDDRKGGNLRVIASIDDGGLRALRPLSNDFIVAPDGTFVGE